MDSVEVGLLIRLNCPGAVRPRDAICGNENDPYAVRSLLGWYVNGPVRQKSSIDDEVKGYTVGERTIKEHLKWFDECLSWTLRKEKMTSHYREKIVSS